MPRVVERLGVGWWLGRRFFRKDRLPMMQYMDEIGASPRLRQHLWFTWGNFGGTPNDTSVGASAVPIAASGVIDAFYGGLSTASAVLFRDTRRMLLR